MTETDDAIKIFRAVPTWAKLVGAVAAIITSLYAGIRFIVRTEIRDGIEAWEKERDSRRNGWQQQARDRIQKELDEVKRKLEKLDDRIDAVERGR
jgi:hypothetical protein